MVLIFFHVMMLIFSPRNLLNPVFKNRFEIHLIPLFKSDSRDCSTEKLHLQFYHVTGQSSSVQTSKFRWKTFFKGPTDGTCAAMILCLSATRQFF